MGMDAPTIENMIREGIPDAIVTISDLRGDGDHYAAYIVSEFFRVKAGCSSIRWFMPPCKVKWERNYTHWRSRPPCQPKKTFKRGVTLCSRLYQIP